MLNISISEDAKAQILRHYPDAKKILLALNDGSNKFSSAEGCCVIGDRFMLVITKEVPTDFNIRLGNPDFEMYMSSYESNFVTTDLAISINPGTGSLMLRGPEGILDINVAVKEA